MGSNHPPGASSGPPATDALCFGLSGPQQDQHGQQEHCRRPGEEARHDSGFKVRCPRSGVRLTCECSQLTAVFTDGPSQFLDCDRRQ